MSHIYQFPYLTETFLLASSSSLSPVRSPYVLLSLHQLSVPSFLPNLFLSSLFFFINSLFNSLGLNHPNSILYFILLSFFVFHLFISLLFYLFRSHLFLSRPFTYSSFYRTRPPFLSVFFFTVFYCDSMFLLPSYHFIHFLYRCCLNLSIFVSFSFLLFSLIVFFF